MPILDFIIFPRPELPGEPYDRKEVLYELYKDTAVVLLRQSEKSRILASNFQHATIYFTEGMKKFVIAMKIDSAQAKRKCILMLNYIRGLRKDLDAERNHEAEEKMSELQVYMEGVEKEVNVIINKLSEFCVYYLPDEPEMWLTYIGKYFIIPMRKTLKLKQLRPTRFCILEPIEESEC